MINELAKQIHDNAKAKGFFDEPKNIGEMLCLIHSEVSEALEADRKDHYAVKSWNMEHNIPTLDLESTSGQKYFIQEFEVAIKNSFEDELADIIIRVMDLAAYKGIDLEYHIKAKMQYNSLRPHKHNKKY
jgi:NTP pyrophosphatase (non-canonical NTP hydrolase)